MLCFKSYAGRRIISIYSAHRHSGNLPAFTKPYSHLMNRFLLRRCLAQTVHSWLMYTFHNHNNLSVFRQKAAAKKPKTTIIAR